MSIHADSDGRPVSALLGGGNEFHGQRAYVSVKSANIGLQRCMESLEMLAGVRRYGKQL